jgi:hypothetical protein
MRRATAACPIKAIRSDRGVGRSLVIFFSWRGKAGTNFRTLAAGFLGYSACLPAGGIEPYQKTPAFFHGQPCFLQGLFDLAVDTLDVHSFSRRREVDKARTCFPGLLPRSLQCGTRGLLPAMSKGGSGGSLAIGPHDDRRLPSRAVPAALAQHKSLLIMYARIRPA